MANIVLDFLHNYQTGERRESEPATAYQYDEGHVLEAVLPEVITSAEIHYWIRGMEEADAYTPTSITPNSDGSCTVLGNIPNSYFETNGELRIYIVVTDGTASITTYEGKLHIAQRAMPDDYVDDDPDNDAVQIIAAARGYAETSEAWAVGQINGEDVPSTADQYQNNASYYANQAASAASSAAAQASLAPAYDNTATYAVGDYCLHDGRLYECTTAITTAEAWTAAHWTAVTVGGELSNLKDDLNQAIEDFAVPTQEAVDNWLNAHPEATTTVQDDSITYNKLNANVKSKFTALNSDVMTNLFEPLLYNRTTNGVTFTLNDVDNTYTVQGTSTSNVYDTIGTISLEPGTYKLLGLVQSGSATTWRINLYATGSGSLIAQDLGSGKVFTISEAVTCRLVLYINSGVTIDIDFKPMITTNLDATIEDYVPYNGIANRLNENVSALSYDLYKSMLTGDKIHNDNVGWMADIAKTWLDNASKIWYSYDGNLFYDEVIETDGKYPMTCSVFVSAMIFGISFYNSKYNGKTANAYNNFAYSDQTLLALLRNESFASELMLPYFIKKGYAFIPEPDLSNVEMGDILYVDSNQTNNPTNNPINNPTPHNVSHSAIFAYPLNSTQYRVWEVGGNAGPVQMAYTFDYARENVKFAVRLPFKTWQTNVRRVTLSTAEFTAPTPLTSLFDFNYNYVANMWKVTLLGTAYGAGGDCSSIYLLRTNMAGAISAKTKLFEGTGAACRKLDANNAIYDSEGNYVQPVTVVVEWLGG